MVDFFKAHMINARCLVHSKLRSITPVATNVHMIDIMEFCGVFMDA
jgi:hypothetical protein